MKRFIILFRLSIGLVALSVCALFSAQWMGLYPDREQAVLDGRKSLCEALAVHCSLAAAKNDLPALKTSIQAVVARNPDVISAGVRRENGTLLTETGEHNAHWKHADIAEGRFAPSYIEVPILQGSKKWGAVEISFRPLDAGNWMSFISDPFLRLVAFVTCASLVAVWFYLRRILQMLDPAAVIPKHVRETLDTLAEGVLVLDKNQRIVLANQAFSRTVGKTAEQLQGRHAPDIDWTEPQSDKSPKDLPWARALQDGNLQKGTMLGLRSATEGSRTLMVNSTCIKDDKGRSRGVLATFDDVTAVEQKNQQLSTMLNELQTSRDEIHRQNKHLQALASRDPMTGCFNRRAFFEQFETHWSAFQRYRQPTSCIMVDVDHFKSVNDTHGHSTGDQVLQKVAAALQSAVREGDIVCRYGGEEFCVLLPHLDITEAAQAAERYRRTIASLVFPNLTITASLGVSSTAYEAISPQDLLDQADKCLYVAKRNGRNQVVRFDAVPTDLVVDEKTTARSNAPREPEPDVSIPFHAVTALTSALGYRDTLTAEHSRRVADLCVLAAAGVMSQSESYVLEVAAQLHDIGKLGVPDAILLKPGPLTDAEWEVMGTHDRIGVEIISAAFSSPALTAIVRTHHAWFGGNPRSPGLPTGEAIPVGARILAIADAYDAMVSDRVYRKGRTPEAAFNELRKCAGKQFDPELVERFVAVIGSHDQSRNSPRMNVSKQAALRIGVQIERLAEALDTQNLPDLTAMAGRLAATAQREGVLEIAQLAADLQRTAASEKDLLAVVELTTELLKVCRSTQTAYLNNELSPHDELVLA